MTLNGKVYPVFTEVFLVRFQALLTVICLESEHNSWF